MLDFRDIENAAEEIWWSGCTALRVDRDEYKAYPEGQKWRFRHMAIAAAEGFGFVLDPEVLEKADEDRRRNPQMNMNEWRRKKHRHACVKCAENHTPEECLCALCGRPFKNPNHPVNLAARRGR